MEVCMCMRTDVCTPDPLITNHTTTHHTTHHTQLLSPSMYTEMSRFDPIGAGFMLSIDDDGFFTVSSDPRVRLRVSLHLSCMVGCVGISTVHGVRPTITDRRGALAMTTAGGHGGGGAQDREGGQDPGDRGRGHQGRYLRLWVGGRLWCMWLSLL